MTGGTHRFAWVPPLIVGACAAIAAEVALGLLLYAGPGFMRSLTTVLAVEGAALGWGLWAAPGRRPDLVDQLRRRWLLCLAAFLVAAGYGTAWSVLPGLGGGGLGQGIGLALLAALPLYGCGAVLGGMASVAASDASRRGPGASAALGAAVGFIVTGFLLPRAPIPASLLIACLVLLSAGGMLYGAVLGHRLHVHVRAARATRGGDVRVEDHRLPRLDLAARVLVEGEHVRRRVDLGGLPDTPWDIAVARALLPGETRERRVLMLGGGASTLPRTLLEEHPTAKIEVLERNGAVVELARDHLDTGLRSGVADRLNVRIGNLEDLIAETGGRFDLVLVDTAALAPMGGIAVLSKAARSRLLAAVDADGAIVWGPVAPDPGTPALGNGWQQTVLERSRVGVKESVVLARAGGTAPRTISVDEFGPASGSDQAQ